MLGPGRYAPAFFDTQMLTSVTTSAFEGSNPQQQVDTWDLGYAWQASDVGADLTLASVTHQGDVGGTRALAPVQLGYADGCLPNRVQYDTTFPAMIRCRLTDVTSETGAQTDVSYYPVSLSTCNPGVSPPAPPSPSANQWPCFPQEWTQGDLGGTGPTATSWFHKYLVSQVMTTDATGSNPPLVSSYQYCNDPSCSAPLSGAAWHYDTDIDLVPAKDKSWSQWRGFAYVRQTAGAAGGTQSQTRYTFLRGMDGDPAPKSGGGFTYPPVTVAPSRASANFPAAVTDAAALNGFTLETAVMDGPGGAQASDTVS